MDKKKKVSEAKVLDTGMAKGSFFGLHRAGLCLTACDSWGNPEPVRLPGLPGRQVCVSLPLPLEAPFSVACLKAVVVVAATVATGVL